MRFWWIVIVIVVVIRVMIVMVAVIIVVMPCTAVTISVVWRIAMPVVWRVPAVIEWTPEEVEDDRNSHVGRLDHVVGAIDIAITYDLNHGLVVFLFLHDDGGNILVDILCQNGLDEDNVSIVVWQLHYAHIVNVTVAVEVKVGNLSVVIVDTAFEVFQCSCFAEDVGDGTKVEVFADVFIGGFHCDGVLLR